MRRRAVVIGSADYAADSGIPSYDWIRSSADRYVGALHDDAMWDDVRRVTDEELRTPDGVMRAVQEVADATEPGDVFMVVYVGHGAYWKDIPGEQVHFSVASSRRSAPWTWLASWYLYRAMRRSNAGLKVLIADCCYSNKLPMLGPGSSEVMAALDAGTCLLTATKDEQYHADAEGCPALPEGLRECTPFSGHLLNVLARGTKYHGQLTLGVLRDAVRRDLENCPTPHGVPNMTLNGAREGTPLFTNSMPPTERNPRPGHPVEPGQWVETLLQDQEFDLTDLLRDPRRTGEVVAGLYAKEGGGGRALAHRIDERANQKFQPHEFARYWNRLERVLRG